MYEQSDSNGTWKAVTEADLRTTAASHYGNVDEFLNTVRTFNGTGIHLNANTNVRYIKAA